MSYLDLIYNDFISRISQTNKKELFLDLCRNGLFFILFATLLAFLLISSEALLEFTKEVRTIIYYGYFSILFTAILYIIYKFFIGYRRINDPLILADYAGKIGKSYPEIKDNLLNALQIYENVNRSEIFSRELAAEAILQVDKKTKSYDFKRTVSFEKNKRLILYTVLTVLIFITLLTVFPNVFLNSAERLINYNYIYVDNSLGIAFDVYPGNIEISKGEPVELTARVRFNDPEYSADKVSLYINELTHDGAILSTNSEKLKAAGNNEFKKTLTSVNSNISYYFELKGVRSSNYNVSVSARPVIKKVNIAAYPPEYTKLPSRIIDGKDIVVIAGTQIVIDAETSAGIERSSVLFRDGFPLNLEIDGNHSKGSFIAREGSFRITLGKMQGDRELTNLNSPEYNIKVIPDEFPKINIVEPSSIMEIQNSGKELLIRSRIYDDFGFSKMQLGYKISKTNYGKPDSDFRYLEIPIKNPDATGVEVPYSWLLSSLKLGTDDEVEYFVEVFDNDAVAGPKSAKSGIYKLVMPSLEALLKETEKTKEDIESELNSAYEDAIELEKALDELKDELNNDKELGLNDPAKNKELQNKIENLQNKFSHTQQKLNEMINEMQNNNSISPETLDKFMELQQMFSKIDSKELREALQRLQEAIKNMNKEQLAEAMKNFKFDEEAFKKAIEKTKELLDKIMNEQKLGELTQKLDDITKKQDQLKDETKNTDSKDQNKMNEESAKQEQIKKEYEELKKQLEQLRENMKKSNNEISKEMEKLLKEMQKRNVENKMNKSSQQLQQGNKNNSEKQQEQISKDLNEMNQQMQDMLASMLEMENNPMMQKMQEFLDKLQQMSQKQGELKNESDGLDKDDEKSEFEKQSKEQQKLSNDLSNTIEDMMSMGKQMGMTPMMAKNLGDAFKEMNDAVSDLNKQDGNSANKHQGSAKENLDKAIEKLSQMCQNGKNPGKGSSLSQLLQGLNDLIQRQTQLNNKMDGMGMNGNQGKMSQEQMAQMQRLAMEQETIRKNLQQLDQEFKKQQEMEGKKMLGDLNQIEKDMMEIIKDLQNGNIKPETKKRQEKILSRLLDFQLSTREKDFEKKRESRPGKNFDRQSPQEVVITRPNIINGINQDILEIYKESYSEDYEILIQKYMQLIKNGVQ